MKTLILTLVCLLLVIPCQAAEKQLKQDQQIQEQLENQEEQLKDKENYFISRIAELRLRAAAEIRLLEVAEIPMPDWAGFDKWADFAETVLQINGCEDKPFGLFEPKYKGSAKRLAVALRPGALRRYQPTSEISAKRLAIALSRIAKRKNDILGKSEFEALNLERQKEYALTVGFAKLEKRSKENAIIPKSKATHGLVKGIVYSSEKPSTVVDHQIVHEGETIHGVVVVKIYKDKVEFEKNGKKWEQKVQQTPEAFWK